MTIPPSTSRRATDPVLIGLISELRYKAFGETRYSAGETPTTFRYTGQREEVELGLYDYNARWYDPMVGRFVSADTIVPGAGNPQGLNRHEYVYNNPTKHTDPTGHMVDWGGGGGGCVDKDGDGICDSHVEPIKSGGDEVGVIINDINDFISIVTLPVGTPRGVDRPEWAQTISGLFYTCAFYVNLMEFGAILDQLPMDEDLLALIDVGLKTVGSYAYGETYDPFFSSPVHPDLPNMLVVNQDILVAGADFVVAGSAKGLFTIIGSVVPGAGNVVGYETGLGVDVVSTGVNYIYDIGRYGLIPNAVSVGVGFAGVRPDHIYILIWPYAPWEE